MTFRHPPTLAEILDAASVQPAPLTGDTKQQMTGYPHFHADDFVRRHPEVVPPEHLPRSGEEISFSDGFDVFKSWARAEGWNSDEDYMLRQDFADAYLLEQGYEPPTSSWNRHEQSIPGVNIATVRKDQAIRAVCERLNASGVGVSKGTAESIVRDVLNTYGYQI